MKNGLLLIAQERLEQKEKHGFTVDHDGKYTDKELLKAANYCLMVAEYKNYKDQNVFWPWKHAYFEHSILKKTKSQKLMVAGAFLMAENDRRNDNIHDDTIKEIADEIDRLLTKNRFFSLSSFERDINNCVFGELSGAVAWIESELPELTEEEGQVEYTISVVWMTNEEHENLGEYE